MKKNMKKIKDEDKLNRRTKRQITFIMLFFVCLFLFMSYYIVDYSIKNQKTLISNSYNTRQKIFAAKNIRGTIYSKDGDVLVSSSVNENGNEVRNYAYGRLFSHVIGYATNGKMGVESDANYYLINSNAPVQDKAALDAKGEKYPGDSVYTTLDLKLQKVAFDALGVSQGAVIVTEPSTGKVLAMVSKPDFDPAEIQYTWDELISSTGSSVLLNRVTQGKYPPGSTFKIITALEYYKEHPEDYNNYRFNCVGSITKGEDTIRCYHGSVHGSVDFMKSFAKSCNSSFVNMGYDLDRDKFGDTLNKLLFNADLPTAFTTSKDTMIVNKSTIDSDMVQLVIGQGPANISPIHLNMITAAIANDGLLMEPYVIDRIENNRGTVVKSYKPKNYGNILSEEEASIMKGLMEDVVIEGTATKLKGMSYYAAGKTGSAEFGTVKGESHAWFTGYAGMGENAPDLCVTIIVESAGSGGDYAVPIAKRIFNAYYDVSN